MKIHYGKNGIYTSFETPLFEGLRKIQANPEGADLKEHIKSRVGKIPFKVIMLALILLNRLGRKYNTEIMITINYNNRNGWYIDIPEQSTTVASVNFKLDSKKYSEIFLELHTHPSHGDTAFSGTDHDDQKSKMRFYGVIGKITLEDPFSNAVDFDSIIEVPEELSDELKQLEALAEKRINKERQNYNGLYFKDDNYGYFPRKAQSRSAIPCDEKFACPFTLRNCPYNGNFKLCGYEDDLI